MNTVKISQVSLLYVILPVLIIIFIITLFFQRRLSQPTGFSITDKTIIVGMLIGYIALYSYLTITNRTPGQQPRINLNLFWSYKKAFQVIGTALLIRRLDIARQILLNILVMIPIGLLLPLVYHRYKHLYLLASLTGFTLSILTETLQYFTHLGLCELDDILDNTLGCLLGVLLFRFGSWVTSRIFRYNKANNSNN